VVFEILCVLILPLILIHDLVIGAMNKHDNDFNDQSIN